MENLASSLKCPYDSRPESSSPLPSIEPDISVLMLSRVYGYGKKVGSCLEKACPVSVDALFADRLLPSAGSRTSNSSIVNRRAVGLCISICRVSRTSETPSSPDRLMPCHCWHTLSFYAAIPFDQYFSTSHAECDGYERHLDDYGATG